MRRPWWGRIATVVFRLAHHDRAKRVAPARETDVLRSEVLDLVFAEALKP
jgi:hypothetical protein